MVDLGNLLENRIGRIDITLLKWSPYLYDFWERIFFLVHLVGPSISNKKMAYNGLSDYPVVLLADRH